MATIDDLIAKVREQAGVVQSMQVFVRGLEQQVKDALAGSTLTPQTQAKLDQVFGEVSTNTKAISEAIDADPNTPQAKIDEAATAIDENTETLKATSAPPSETPDPFADTVTTSAPAAPSKADAP